MAVAASAFAELAKSIARDDAPAIVAAANKCLSAVPGDAKALAAKCLALCHEAKWVEAVAAAGSSPSLALFKAYAEYRSDRLEAALATCAIAAAAPGANMEAVGNLRGQLLYRLGRYAEAAAQYDALLVELLEEGADELALNDVRMNMAAVYVAAGKASALLSHPHFADMMDAITKGRAERANLHFELLFNIACALSDAGATASAMRTLAAAYAVGEATLLAEGLEPAKVAAELSVVRAQAAYMLQIAHYDDAAAALYAQTLACHPADASVSLLISSNLTQLRTNGRDLVESYKRLRSLTNMSASHKLLTRQVATLHYNHAVVAYLVRKPEECRAAIARATALCSESSSDPALAALAQQLSVLQTACTLANAAALPDAAALYDALSALAPKAGARLPAPLAVRAQLLVSQAKYADAAKLLTASLQQPLPPAVATAVSQLYHAAGDAAAASSVLTESAAAYDAAVARGDAQAATAAANKAALAHVRAAMLLAAGDVAACASQFEAIAALPSLPNDARGVALACLSIMRTRQAAGAAVSAEEERMARLSDADVTLREATAVAIGAGGRKPSFADFTRFSAEAVDALEWPPADTSARARATAAAASVSAPAAAGAGALSGSVGGVLDVSTPASAAAALKAATAAAAKKRRTLARRARQRDAYVAKLRTERGYDGITMPKPDPERWLPKRERTFGKKSRRRMLNKNINASTGGAQGVGAGSEAVTRELDAKARADAAKAAGIAPKKAAAPAPAPAPAPAKRKGGKRK